MNKKRIILFSIGICILLFIFRVYIVNRNFPQKDFIQAVNINEEVNCDDVNIKILNSQIESIDPEGFPIASISYSIENKTNKHIDLSEIYNKLSLYSNYDKADIQNINLGFDNSQFKNTYNQDELVLKPRQNKIFHFNYYLLKDTEKYNNFVYIDNRLYANDFNQYLNDGTLLYKIINLGNIYEQSDSN